MTMLWFPVQQDSWWSSISFRRNIVITDAAQRYIHEIDLFLTTRRRIVIHLHHLHRN
jgi:hypothetical protein